MARSSHILVSVAVILMALWHGAHAVRKDYPTTSGLPLDWCRKYASECGEPAASEFCRSQGYPGGAIAFSEPKRLAEGVTRVITNGAICDTRYHVCDTFSWIDCRDVAKRFDDPTVKDQPIDYCVTFEQNCGRPAADAFCQSQDFKKAAHWRRRRLTTGTTLTMGDYALCDTNHHVCDTFSWIECTI